VIAQLTDPHLRAGEDGPARALAAAVDTVLGLDPLPDAVVVTGDIADAGDPREYALARELLSPLPLPVHTIPGNHDDAAAFEPPASTLVGGIRLLLCDSTIPGVPGGRLDVAWIDDQLGDEAAPAIVAIHHPPFAIGMPGLDEIGMAADDAHALASLLAARPQVKRVICGHVHRTVMTTLGGCGVLALSSTNIQARLDIGAPAYTLVDEPGAIALHVLLGGEIVSHLQPVVR
jgi:3',5'-cyclic AMP phosphodiesterase CpdA